VTLHRDGEMLVRAGQRFGCKYIRGSGDQRRGVVRKRALHAFRSMLRLLSPVKALSAPQTYPKVARVAGLGIVTLGAYSRASDHSGGDGDEPPASAVELGPHLHRPPFGRMAIVRGKPIHVRAMPIARRSSLLAARSRRIGRGHCARLRRRRRTGDPAQAGVQ